MKWFDSSWIWRKCFCAVCVAAQWVSLSFLVNRMTTFFFASILLFLKDGSKQHASWQTIHVLTWIPRFLFSKMKWDRPSLMTDKRLGCPGWTQHAVPFVLYGTKPALFSRASTLEITFLKRVQIKNGAGFATRNVLCTRISTSWTYLHVSLMEKDLWWERSQPLGGNVGEGTTAWVSSVIIVRNCATNATKTVMGQLIGLNESLFYRLHLFRCRLFIWCKCAFHSNWFISFYGYAIFFWYYNSSFIKPCFIAEASAIQINKRGLKGIAIVGIEWGFYDDHEFGVIQRWAVSREKLQIKDRCPKNEKQTGRKCYSTIL